MKLTETQSGFSLIEIMVVLAIMGLLAEMDGETNIFILVLAIITPTN